MALAYCDSDVNPGLFSRILSSRQKSLGIALDPVHSRILLGFTKKSAILEGILEKLRAVGVSRQSRSTRVTAQLDCTPVKPKAIV